jgi:hypothetical protein
MNSAKKDRNGAIPEAYSFHSTAENVLNGCLVAIQSFVPLLENDIIYIKKPQR